MQDRFYLKAFATIYAFAMPLIVGMIAVWHPFRVAGIATLRGWQTLEAGALAIVAALIGGYFVYRQTGEARRQENDRIARKHASARAVLPLALSALVAYCEAVAQSLSFDDSVGFRVVRMPGSGYTPPQYDASLISPLRDLIESASPDVSERVSRIIAEVQILQARLISLGASLRPGSRSVPVLNNVIDYTINAATVYARASALFEYARRVTDDAPPPFPTEQQLITALNLMGFDESTDADMYSFARARTARWVREGAA